MMEGRGLRATGNIVRFQSRKGIRKIADIS